MESQIRKIQQKYWDGESTVQEEKLLKEHFSKTNDSDLEAKYFEHLNQKSEIKYKQKFKHPGKTRFLPRWIMAAAIMIGILGSAYLFNINNKQNEFLVEDPQEAYEITQKALLTISAGLNKATILADNLGKFDTAKEKISE